MTALVKDLLLLEPANQSVTVKGWVRTKRDSKNVCFLEVTDGSCLKNLQIIISKEENINGADENSLNRITTGASVIVEGILVPSMGKNQKSEVQASSLTLVGEAPAEIYPLQKKRHSVEFLREHAHLRPRTNLFGAVARIRNSMSYAIHTFFQEKGFQYIHTPILTSADCEGAGDMFQVTTLDMNTLPKTKDGKVDYEKDFFGKQAFLTVSGQLNVENYACALTNVYTFGPTFRAENSNTSRHLAEFWMMEPEMAFCDIVGNMDVAEEFLKYVLSWVLEKNAEDMAFFNQWVQKGIIDTLKQVIDADFTRITYTEAVDKLLASGQKFEYPVSWGADLQSEHEKYLTEEVYKGPVIVTDYPKEIKAFYMKLNEDGKTVRAMDILVPRLGEIIGGFEREADLATLEGRLEELNLNPEDYWWYLDLRRYGTVPHSGFGLGFERLIQYVTGVSNIRDVIPFPRAVKTIDF